MYRTAFKNFFKNIVYIFVPMGIVYLFLLIALFALFYAFMGQTGEMLTALAELIKVSTEQSSADVSEFFAYAFEQIQWNGNFFDTLREILDTDWLSTTVRGFFETLNASTEGFDASANAIFSNYSAQISMDLSIAVSIASLGVTLANFMTGWLIRRSAAKRTFKKFIVAHTIVPLVQSAVIIVSTVLLSVIQYYSLLVFAAMVAISCAFSLTSSWLIHGKGKIDIREVLTPKNILQHVGILALSFLIDAVLAVLLFFVSPLLALLLMIPVFIYTFAIVDVNTDSYMLYLVDQKAQAEAAPPEGKDEPFAPEAAPVQEEKAADPSAPKSDSPAQPQPPKDDPPA